MIISPARPFCVYTHAMNGVVFYVGKGPADRACSIRTRSKLWRQKVGDRNFTVEIVSRHETDAEALAAEVALIKHLKPECNAMHHTYVVSAERRAALRKRRVGVKRTEQAREQMKQGWARAIAEGRYLGRSMIGVTCVETGMQFRSIKQAGASMKLDSSSIRKCVNGEVKTVGGYSFRRSTGS